MKPKLFHKSDLYKLSIVFTMLLILGLVTTNMPNDWYYGGNPFMYMWVLVGFPIGVSLRYWGEKADIKRHKQNENRKTDWFNAYGSFQTKQPMTTKELVALLDEIDEKYGLFYGGKVSPFFKDDKK